MKVSRPVTIDSSAAGTALEASGSWDDGLLDHLDEGVVVIDSEGRVLRASRRAGEMLFDPAGVEVSRGDLIADIVKAVVGSGTLILPDGVGEDEYTHLMMSAIAQNIQNVHAVRLGLPALRISCRDLSTGSKIITLVEHIFDVVQPIATRQNASRRSEGLPVVVAREGFEIPDQLAEALEMLEEGFALYDAQYRFVLCNRKFSELLFVDPEARPRPGESMDDIVLRAGRTNASRGKPENMTIEAYAEAATAAFKSLAKNQRYELNDGRVMEVSGYRTKNGGFLYTLLDVTEREAAAEEADRQRIIAHQNEKLSALGELLAGVAHELNNPLSIVVGFSQMLEDQLDEESQLRKIGKIRTAAERSARIVKTFLAMARQRPARIERAEPADIVETAADIAAYGFRADGGQVVMDLPQNIPDVKVDKDQLIQVVSNLIVNAEQAMKGSSSRAVMELAVTSRDDVVEVSVVDNGPGMDAATQQRIFEPFFTTKEVGEGTGFGLAFCHRIVTAHDGELRVESAPGKGSRFVIALPAAKGDPKAGSGGTEDLEASPMKILVVDDERDVADLLRDMLAQRGHDVGCVYSPFDAIAAAQTGDFDAIISDIKMPGLSGDAMMKFLIQSQPKLEGRFGFVTGDSLSSRVHAFLEGGTHPFIEKPIVAEELDGLVNQLRRKARP